MKKIVLVILFGYYFNGLWADTFYPNYLVRCNEKLVDVIMEDLFTPPVASRVHVYPNIAAYEVLAIGNSNLLSLSNQINHLPKINLAKENINYSVAAEFAFTTVAKKLVFSESMISDFEYDEKKIWEKKIADTVLLNKSINFGINAGKQIIEWMMKDNYIYVKTLERYVVSDSLGAWQPTAPEYTNAIEPNWYLMRTLVCDSSFQVKPVPNIAYSEDKSSEYYKNAFNVYQASKSLDTVKKLIASFWDCNPNISYSKGHLTFFMHKVSPGGHWIRIAGQAIRNLDLDELKTTEIYTLVTIGLYEGFLSCWAEKYRSNAVRPETYINRVIDPKWLPLIQTPPFPEYTSGHSVISNVSATILSELIPKNYSFSDSSEMYIDIPPRTFNSFKEAADEAGISRFYGGIHFMPSIIYGSKQGIEIGRFILQKIKTRK